MSERYERAKEKIRKALVEEYLKQNPRVKEQEVIMLCKEGKLIFTDMASVMAEIKVRNNFTESMKNAEQMFANLAVHENQRWKECTVSADYSQLMIDCLSSSPFNHFDHYSRKKEHDYVDNQERICARATVKLQEKKEKLYEFKKEGINVRTPRGRSLVIEYLNWVIYQLKTLHNAFEKKVELGNIFAKHATNYINIIFEEISQKKVPFSIHLDDLRKVYSVLNRRNKTEDHIGEIAEANKNVLNETKKVLVSSIDNLKIHIEKRRIQFQEIWKAISSMKEVNSQIDKLNRLDAAGKMPPESAEHEPTVKRMIRFTKSSDRYQSD